MRVEITENTVAERRVVERGQLLELPETEALALIRIGRAVPAPPPEPEPEPPPRPKRSAKE